MVSFNQPPSSSACFSLKCPGVSSGREWSETLYTSHQRITTFGSTAIVPGFGLQPVDTYAKVRICTPGYFLAISRASQLTHSSTRPASPPSLCPPGTRLYFAITFLHSGQRQMKSELSICEKS